jgi:hypothetical protein
MKTTKRFEKAVMKLYKAFHDDELNAWNCQKCAVGNLCDGDSNWVKIISNGAFDFRTIDLETDLSKIIDIPNVMNTNYSALELAEIENLFMFGRIMKKNIEPSYFDNISDKKEKQFKGLCAVVEYLAELDNIPNPMDYTKLFETENNKPKYQLTDAI